MSTNIVFDTHITNAAMLAEMVHDLGDKLTEKQFYGLIDHIDNQARLHGPYASKLSPGEIANVDYISDKQKIGAMATTYYGVKHYLGHIDYTRAGDSKGMTRNGSDTWTLKHKATIKAGKSNPPTGWLEFFKRGEDDYSMAYLAYAIYHWTVPYMAEKVDRPSHAKWLNKSGNTAAPFKNGIDRLADFFKCVLDEGSQKTLTATLDARRKDNLANGYVNPHGPSLTYRESCADTREARGINMTRSGTPKTMGIYTRMSTEQDAEASALVYSSYYEKHLSQEDLLKEVAKYVTEHCASQEKMAALSQLISDTTQVRDAMAALPSQQAEAEKYSAKIETLKGQVKLDAKRLAAVLGPSTSAALKVVLQKAKEAAATE